MSISVSRQQFVLRWIVRFRRELSSVRILISWLVPMLGAVVTIWVALDGSQAALRRRWWLWPIRCLLPMRYRKRDFLRSWIWPLTRIAFFRGPPCRRLVIPFKPPSRIRWIQGCLMPFLDPTEHNVTNFGLFSKSKMHRVAALADSLGVRYYFDEVTRTEENLRLWTAWDEFAAEPHRAFKLWTHHDDYNKIGTAIVDC